MFKRISIILLILFTLLAFTVGVNATALTIVKPADNSYIDYQAGGVSIFKIADTGTVSGGNIAAQSTYGLYFDFNAPFATITNIHSAALLADVTTTSHVASGIWSAWGRLYGARITVNLAHKVTNTFGLKAEVITTGTTNINDVVGVMGALEIDGVHTKGQTSSSMAALRGDINNTSDGSWDAQVYTLFLNYGSGKNYGGTTAWIHAYNHGDSYLDYGISMAQNSTAQALTAGIYLNIAAGTTVTTGIHLAVTGTLVTGINIGACTTGISFTGACTTAAISMNSATFAAGDNEIEMRNNVDGDKTVIASGAATDDTGIVTAVGADADIADGSLYMSCTDSGGVLFIKKDDVWTAFTNP